MSKSQTIYYYYIIGNSLKGSLVKKKNKKNEFTRAPVPAGRPVPYYWCGSPPVFCRGVVAPRAIIQLLLGTSWNIG